MLKDEDKDFAEALVKRQPIHKVCISNKRKSREI
jgi:hypothetical protein